MAQTFHRTQGSRRGILRRGAVWLAVGSVALLAVRRLGQDAPRAGAVAAPQTAAADLAARGSEERALPRRAARQGSARSSPAAPAAQREASRAPVYRRVADRISRLPPGGLEPTRVELLFTEAVDAATYILTDADRGAITATGPVRVTGSAGTIDFVGSPRSHLFVTTERGCAVVHDLETPGGKPLVLTIALSPGATLSVDPGEQPKGGTYAAYQGDVCVAFDRGVAGRRREHVVPAGAIELSGDSVEEPLFAYVRAGELLEARLEQSSGAQLSSRLGRPDFEAFEFEPERRRSIEGR